MKKWNLTKLTKKILDGMFYGGIAVCLFLPLILHYIGNFFPHYQIYYLPMLVLLFLSGILAVLIVLELRSIFGTMLQGSCFVQENVRSLRRMGNYSFCISALTACRLIIVITPATLVILLVFLIAGLFSKVLSQVFDQAVSYKEENDLTI